MSKPIIAILYDFDNTLCTRDMQEYTFIPGIGMEAGDFWDTSDKMASSQQMDKILAYMYCMLHLSDERGVPFKRDDLVACGKSVEYQPGVTEWFERINRYGMQVGVQVEHYVLSSGLKEIIEGTSIAPYFTKIFASEFLYRDDKAIWPKLAVNYTSKTQFVYRINKGVLDISNDYDVNRSSPDEARRVKFSNMIYIGDGLTDVPCMKLIKQSGGHSIGIYGQDKPNVAADLLNHGRVDYAFVADYRQGSPLDETMRQLLGKLALDNQLAELSKQQRKDNQKD